MSKWDDDMYEDWDMDAKIDEFDRFKTLNDNIAACEEHSLTDDFFDDDEEEELENDYEDIEELHSSPVFSATSPVVKTTKNDTPKPKAEQKSYMQEMREKEEAAKRAQEEENEKLRKSGYIFLTVFMSILVIGILFASIGNAVCQTIGYVFLGIDTAVIMFIIAVSAIGKILK
jgi:hypothetical protein